VWRVPWGFGGAVLAAAGVCGPRCPQVSPVVMR
jgi:hypothetical protein